MISPALVVASAFFVLLILFGRKVWSLIKVALDNYIERINREISFAISSNKAVRTRIDSALLQKRQALEQVQSILHQAENNSFDLRNRIMKELENYKVSEKLALQKRLEQVSFDLRKEVKEELISLSIMHASQILLKQGQQKDEYQNMSIHQVVSLVKSL